MGIQHVLQVGDFGLWPPMSGVLFLDEVQESAKKNNLTVYAIPGNHEWHDEWEHIVETAPKSKGFAMVRSRIALAPKVHHWHWNNKQFISAGGAVSVDKEWRLQAEAGTAMDYTGRCKASGPRTLWWPNEELTDKDVQNIRMLGKRADYLITHDCSNNTEFRFRLKSDPDSEIHRRRIDEVISLTKPSLHFHGHMHTKYDWLNGMSHGYTHYTQTYGLEADGDWDSWGVLDTDTDEFKWRGEDPKAV